MLSYVFDYINMTIIIFTHDIILFLWFLCRIVTLCFFLCYNICMNVKRFLFLFILAVLLVSFSLISCESNTMEVISREYVQQGVSVNLEYPVFSASKELNRKVENDISSYLDSCINECIDNNFDEGVFYVTYVPDRFTKDEVSFTLEFYRYIGGANGITGVETYNYSFKEKKWLDLTDVTTKSQEEISRDLYAVLNAKYNPEKDPGLEDSIERGTSDAGNLKKFTFTEKSLTFHYPKYEVLPGYFGVVSAEISR